ncbi:hypothetical protein K431DRAFT_288138 [Polychaeton citri CBS 116435]|uniref:CUE domain-containing protein n=1 Tax=Polychaeton citri CBS 116435 TaxID=1314669 RepID=A0A9P4UJF7_9PEZI|nr:hypothetical protein K431DRAFT_288138 [Polychaeton citri CBS 116435]
MPDEPVSPVKATSREEMDFDSDHEQETGKVSPLGTESADKKTVLTKSPSPKPRVSFQDGPAEEIPPAKPPRPLSPAVQAENTLIEAFPSIDTKVVKAVLQASGGHVEPAFNALLGMSDPNFKPETPPAQPPRPGIRQQPQQQRQPMNQLEADELYARQLAEHYSGSGGNGGQYYNQREPGRRGPNQQRPTYDEEDREHSFFDDDLPEIGKNIQQGFFDTQKKVNSWIMNFKKKLDGEEEEDLYSGSSQQGSRVGTISGESGTAGGRKDFGSSQSEQLYGIRKSAEQQRRMEERRSMDAQRYDRDPQMIDDDQFQRLELRDEEDQPPPQPPRSSSAKKPTNPDLFKPTPQPPQSGPVDEVDAAERKASNNGGSGTSQQQKKWQPLTSVAPAPEEDNDPFSVGDDDENQDDKKEDQMKEASERLKNQARQSVSEGGSNSSKVLAESGNVGTKNKEAEELLGGK